MKSCVFNVESVITVTDRDLISGQISYEQNTSHDGSRNIGCNVQLAICYAYVGVSVRFVDLVTPLTNPLTERLPSLLRSLLNAS